MIFGFRFAFLGLRTGKEIRFRFGSSEDKADTTSRSRRRAKAALATARRSQPKMEDNLFTSPKYSLRSTSRLPENLATPNLFIILSGKRLANIIIAD